MSRLEALRVETKSMHLGIPETWETKTVRRVRTAAGVKRYGQPIGSIIIGGGAGKLLTNLKLEESEYSGFDKVKTKKGGKTMYIGKFPGETSVTVNDENDEELYSAKNLEDAFKWANEVDRGAAGSKKPNIASGDPADKYKKDLVDPQELSGMSKTKLRALEREMLRAQKTGTNRTIATNLTRVQNEIRRAESPESRNSATNKRRASIQKHRDRDRNRSPSNLQKIQNAERMYGTGSAQHREAQRRFGGTKNHPSPTGSKEFDMQLDYKAVPISGVEDTEEGIGVVEAIVAVTGIKDNVNDIILPGAFQKSLAKRTPKGVWHHNIQESVSRTEFVKELQPGDDDLPKTLPDGSPWPAEAGGLKVKTIFNLNTQRGKDAYEDVKFFGTQQEWSIGYNVPMGGATIDKKTGVRKINTLDLYEYSPVLFGAMPNARTVSVKSAQEAHKVILDMNLAENMEYKSLMDEIIASELLEIKSAKKKDDEEEDEVESDDDTAEETEETEEETEEETDEDEEVETTKKKRGSKSLILNADGVDMLDVAIKALGDFRDFAIEQLKADAEEEQSDDSGSEQTLSGLVDSAGVDASGAAKDFDTAVTDGDSSAMETAANSVLDAVETAKESDDVDTDALKAITSYIASAFQNVEPGEDEPTEEKSEVEEEEEGDEIEPDEQKANTTITLDHKDFLAQFGAAME